MKLTIPFELELEVQYTVDPPTKGRRDSLMGIPGAGAQLEPDDPGGIDIYAVRHNGCLVYLSKDEVKRLEDLVAEAHTEKSCEYHHERERDDD